MIILVLMIEMLIQRMSIKKKKQEKSILMF